MKVYCDMDYDGGGWTVIQRRGAPLERGVVRQDFAQGWSAYEKGFGSAEQDYWIGKWSYFLDGTVARKKTVFWCNIIHCRLNKYCCYDSDGRL